MTFRPEFALIERIRKAAGGSSRVLLGIGDDAAGLGSREDRETLVATDMLLDGVHFVVEECGPYWAGRKALAVNLSDLAAMGGRCIASFVSIAIPRNWNAHEADELMRGVLELAAKWDCPVAGGDTNSWDGRLVINVAVVGETIEATSIRRAGAQVGDVIVVSGALGGSIYGRHLKFEPRLDVAAELLKLAKLNSMIDLSDGLSSDLWHILRASHAGAVLEQKRIPVHEDVRHHADVVNLSSPPALAHALHDGEDFELLFTLSPAQWETLRQNWKLPIALTKIGTIVSEEACRIVSETGESKELVPGGYVHRFG
ncbi:thiamine-monophosphate kinase [Planctopirus limnophila DSM 3776]|uniref:Thiamine-monophosphate kinase n=1 Tax=Planctopirus limnophila (strain ATCC 43296 / DSM 3776 / IFAM 1008 / Mu 290) TaxID=521674 RepID=D5SUM6_PLAL2|nr:thiamine-phosphate kinase [Planctopirus limnophila]ADG67078.1 thiamine-monophosphate kinase [Planctopirus limnophila DSM 3776]